MAAFNRRLFLKTGSAVLMPTLLPGSTLSAAGEGSQQQAAANTKPIKFYGDGEMFEPEEYLQELSQAYATTKFEKDRYGEGGVVQALEARFAAITGKEKAIFMPSGTMANQLALSVLSGEKAKIFVQETSHIYRDEADAAQTVFNKRLMPLAAGETFFTAQQLQNSIEALAHEEVFNTGVGAVSIENPVRRTNGKTVPLEEIQKISAYCRNKNIGLHLDGARLFMASAWTGIPVKQYASYFDTVYISLYKYFGASGGAILCGNKEIIQKMPHLIKVHGGSIYGNWTNAAMALHRLEGFDRRLEKAIKMATEIFNALNQQANISIKPLPGGTNIYSFALSKTVDGKKMQERLHKEFAIRMPRPNSENLAFLSVNETLLYQSAGNVINAFRQSINT
jgi:threonine aldolase